MNIMPLFVCFVLENLEHFTDTETSGRARVGSSAIADRLGEERSREFSS